MQTISSNLAKQTFGRILEKAQREPILIEKHNHPTAVLLSISEYDRIKLKEPEKSLQRPKTPVSKPSVAKSLPVIPTKAGSSPSRLSTQEMIELVHEAETELNE